MLVEFGMDPKAGAKLFDRDMLRLAVGLAAAGEPFGDELVILLGGFRQAGFTEINRPSVDADERLSDGLVGTQLRNCSLFCRVQ